VFVTTKTIAKERQNYSTWVPLWGSKNAAKGLATATSFRFLLDKHIFVLILPRKHGILAVEITEQYKAEGVKQNAA